MFPNNCNVMLTTVCSSFQIMDYVWISYLYSIVLQSFCDEFILLEKNNINVYTT